MATSKIKSLGYTASAKTRCGTALTIPSSATDCYVVVYVANGTSVMQSIVPLKMGIGITGTEGMAGGSSLFNYTLGTNLSFTVSAVWWYGSDRTSESYYQLFYK